VKSSRNGFALVVLCLASAAGAQTFPTGPMRLIVPFPPGGGTDILARPLAQKLGERFKQPVVIENRGGANGTIGTAYVAKSVAADGHTLLVVPSGYAVNPSLYLNLPYDQSRELAAVTQLVAGPLTLVVHPSLPVKNAGELIALARARPGELNYGSSGIGSLPHLAGEWFALTAGIRLTHVPYKGSGAATVDVMNGEVPVYFMNVLQSLPFIRQGRLRALGVTGLQRSTIAKDIPTVAEGGLPGFDMATWFGVLAPAATPREIIVRLHSGIVASLQQNEMRERLAADGMTVVASAPEQFTAFLRSEIAKYARIVQAAGLKSQ
jgi:tripartite-type tricarboxylate transporter receptor subunit TctC